MNSNMIIMGAIGGIACDLIYKNNESNEIDEDEITEKPIIKKSKKIIKKKSKDIIKEVKKEKSDDVPKEEIKE